jgi:hypothetical protein
MRSAVIAVSLLTLVGCSTTADSVLVEPPPSARTPLALLQGMDGAFGACSSFCPLRTPKSLATSAQPLAQATPSNEIPSVAIPPVLQADLPR